MTTLVRWGLLLVTAAGGSVGWAQSRPATESGAGDTSATGAESKPCWLRVTADRVHLRSRADQNSAAVAVVDRDAVLKGLSSEFGWHRVEPPKDVFSYVSATYIDQLDHEQGVVSVASGRLRVRVGSLVDDVDPARGEVQTLLERGTPVRILGRDGDWLRIEPPDGVCVYVSSRLVEEIDADTAARLQAQAAGQPEAVAAATQPTATQPAAPPNLGGQWGQRLVMIEAAIEAEGHKTPLEQSWPPIVSRLRAVVEQREEPTVARLAQGWIARLERRQADQAALQEARALVERDERAQKQFERELTQIHRARQDHASRMELTVRGELFEDASEDRPTDRPRYELHDPQGGRLLAYLEPAESTEINLAEFVGYYIGVRGKRESREALAVDVISVQEIVVLPRETPSSQPARQTP